MRLEHINISVPDPGATADMLIRLFGWHVRWQGEAMSNGHTVHVGDADSYLALYAPDKTLIARQNTYDLIGGLNHIGVVVDDLSATETRVRQAGFEPHSHADYEPGKRFYFDGPDGIEFEVVAYG